MNVFTLQATFSTLTNVDFDPARFVTWINDTVKHREALKVKVKAAGGKVDFSGPAATFTPAATLEELVKQGEQLGIKTLPAPDADTLA